MTPIDDNTLTQTLACLTAVEIPEGLEQRILASLATAEPTAEPNIPQPHQPSVLRRWPLFHQSRHVRVVPPHRPPVTTTLALSGLAAALALAIVGLRHSVITRGSQPPQPTLAVQPAISPLQRTTTSAMPKSTPTAVEARLPSIERVALPHPASTPPSAHSTPIPADTDAALALAETNAPSLLAPPLPLTDDERALQHLAQQSTPSTLLALDPSRRAAEQAAEEAAFVSFFTPPQTPSSQEIPNGPAPN